MKTAKATLIVIGVLSIFLAACGLWYNAMTLSVDFSGGVDFRDLPHFYPAFYTMSAICIACFLGLLLSGIRFLRLQPNALWLFIGILVFEILYLFCVGALWLVPDIGSSIAAATGVANGGLMFQFLLLFPFWAPFPAAWATSRLKKGDLASPLIPQTVAPAYGDASGEPSLQEVPYTLAEGEYGREAEPPPFMEEGDYRLNTPAPAEQHTSVRGRDLLVGVAIIWFLEFLLGIGLVFWTGLPPAFENHPGALLVASLVSATITFLVAWHFVCRKYHKTLLEGFAVFQPTFKTLALSMLLGMIMAVVAGTVTSMFSTGGHLFERMMEAPHGLAFLAVLLLTLPIVEEFYYRGFLFPAIAKRLGPGTAFAIVSVWFMAAHALQSLEDWAVIPVIGVVGAVFTLQRWRTGSLTPPLITHWTYNACLVVFTVVSEYLP